MIKVNPIPPNYPRVSPYLCVAGAAGAMAFYEKGLGATERMRIPMPDGVSIHQPEVGLMDESGRLEGLARSLLRHLGGRQLAQFVVYQRQESLGGPCVAGFD